MNQTSIEPRHSPLAFEESVPQLTNAEGAGTAWQSSKFAFRDPPAWLPALSERLDRLRALEPNWDSYGGKPINHTSIEIAKDVLAFLAIFVSVEEPTVTASGHGHAALCWDDHHRSLDVEILPDGRFHYVFLDAENEDRDEDGTMSDFSHLAVLLTRW